MKKGSIHSFVFDSKNTKEHKLIEGFHRIVVLHSRKTPYETWTIAPITSANALKLKNEIPENYVELKAVDYPCALDHDSYINLDMIMTLNKSDLKNLVIGEKKIKANLTPKDLKVLDFKIALSYELQNYINSQVSQEVENIVEYIDTDVRTKVETVLELLSDPSLKAQIKNILDNDILGEIKSGYLQ
jgi:alpha-amylase/alpha-mannosidase (GH57 family)